MHFWEIDHSRSNFRCLVTRPVVNSRSLAVDARRSMVLASGESANDIELWDVRSLVGNDVTPHWPEVVVHGQGLMLTPDPSRKKSLRVRRMAGGEEIAKLPFDPRAHYLPEISPKENCVAIPQPGGTLGLFETKTWKLVRSLSPPSGRTVGIVAFSPDCRWLAAGLTEVAAGVWHIETGKWREILRRDETHECGRVAWSPTGHQLACFVWPQSDIEVWDIDQVVRISQIQLDSRINETCFLDAQTLAVADDVGLISLWDADSGTRLDLLSGHSARVDCLAVSADGRTLASASFDGSVRLWNIPTRRELFVLNEHPPPPQARVQRLRFFAMVRCSMSPIPATSTGSIRPMLSTPNPQQVAPAREAEGGASITEKPAARVHTRSISPICSRVVPLRRRGGRIRLRSRTFSVSPGAGAGHGG